ncbi:hypothetical protein BJF93_11215 [Xaviernesmea oryzae]|uniref:Uncharacterized protein n=1 Tax=Xaviernesmea oryzae TaxID=464029 RepID=A0A1Q9AW61_9HYPH|nr:hypothetical protein [Xaviernesmea oryzae]OLP59638.1 hypothetical protein BJF93_11215 [Xaviernesmea oryzae]SEM24315.1 hypothetical protein SAMN04487976_12435 [Xaviernesmea oryzae]
MLRLQRWIARLARRNGATEQSANEAARQFSTAPIIQTGPHCHLLVEPDAFYTHLFSLIGITARELRWHVWYSASTVKFIERPRKGPGWLTLDGDLVNVFGLPRSRLDSFNICGTNGPYRFALSTHGSVTHVNSMAERLKALLPSLAYQSAADAIKAANAALWKRWFPPDVELLQVDDGDVGDLLANHLSDDGSWLSQRFVLGGVAVEVLRVVEELDQGPWTGWIRRTTDLFWALERGRLYPLRLQGQSLVGDGGHASGVAFSPMALAEALRQRRIVPSLLVTFIVLSILPGARVLGGCRQTVYYPLMRYVFARALEKMDERDVLVSLRADVRLGMWGHRVLTPMNGQPFAELEQLGNVLELLPEYEGKTLHRACGKLASFTGDPIWAGMRQHIASGEVRPASREWQWA